MFTNFQQIVVGFIIYLSAFTVISQDLQRAQPDPFGQLDKHFYYKCYEATKSMDAYNKLKNDTNDLYSYFGSSIQLLPDHTTQFCEYERSELEKRISAFSKDLRFCLPEKEKYIASFLKESFREFLHFLCHNKGDNVNKFFTPRARHCRQTLLNMDDGSSFGNCLSRIFAPSKGVDSLTKTELCDDLTILKKCFNSILMDKCSKYEPYQVLNGDLFNYISKPCGSASESTNFLSSVLFVSCGLIMSYLY